MSRAYAPAEVIDLAHARREARIAGDWPRADELRAEIEAAGWTVVDRGVDFQLRPAVPPDVDRDGTTFYGASASVPSRLDDPPSTRATVVAVADDPATLTGIITAAAQLPPDVDLVAVVAMASGNGNDVERGIGHEDETRLEVVGTAGPFGIGGAWNAGLRRSRGATAIVVDPTTSGDGGERVADLIAWLVAGGIDSLERRLIEPTVAVVGLSGYASDDLRRFSPNDDGDPVAVGGSIVAFRRTDFVARGPLDEHFASRQAVDIWWSLVLRDEGEGLEPRRAVRVEEGTLLAARGAGGEGMRLPRRDAYRLADRFAASPYLLRVRDVAAPSGTAERTTA